MPNYNRTTGIIAMQSLMLLSTFITAQPKTKASLAASSFVRLVGARRRRIECRMNTTSF